MILKLRGMLLECRINENPKSNFAPSPGVLAIPYLPSGGWSPCTVHLSWLYYSPTMIQWLPKSLFMQDATCLYELEIGRQCWLLSWIWISQIVKVIAGDSFLLMETLPFLPAYQNQRNRVYGLFDRKEKISVSILTVLYVMGLITARKFQTNFFAKCPGCKRYFHRATWDKLKFVQILYTFR